MKYLVPLSLLLVGMAKGQDIDAASLNAVLPEGYTRVCEEGEEPQGTPRGKRQAGFTPPEGPPPCWHIVDADYPRADCDSRFDDICSSEKPYVGRNQNHMCIFFPQANKWFKLSGTYGWCGADNCCDFHPKNQCNPYRPLLTYFPLPAEYNSCDEISDDIKNTLSVAGSELMKGESGSQREVCVLNTDKVWVQEPVNLVDCGGFGCCRFEFVNQPDTQ